MRVLLATISISIMTVMDTLLCVHQPVETLPSRLRRGAIKSNVTVEEAVAGVEAFLPYEIAWIHGGQLLDTVFVCLYPHTQALHQLSTVCKIKREQGMLNRGEL